MSHDLFSYPRSPGFKEPTTSRAAAAAFEPTVENIRARVLHAITAADEAGLTPDECAAGLGLSVLAVRPRYSELGPKHENKIEKTGERRRNAVSGLMAAAWRRRST